MFKLTLVSGPQGQQLNASFTQGDVVGWTFAMAICGVPINITGARIRMTIGMQTPVVFTSDDGGGITITDAVNGKFLLEIPSSDTAPYVPGTYPYDVWLEQNLAPPRETQYITGTVTVNPSISAVP